MLEEIDGADPQDRITQRYEDAERSITRNGDDGNTRQDWPDASLHVEPMICATQYRYPHSAVLLVLASESYVCDFEVFLTEVAAAGRGCS